MSKLLYFFKVKKAAVGSAILIFFFLIAVFAPLLAPFGPTQYSYFLKHTPKKITVIDFEKRILPKIDDPVQKQLITDSYHKDSKNKYYVIDKKAYKEKKADIFKILAPIEIKFGLREQSSAMHWLGTTSNGHDILSHVIRGSSISLLVGISCGILAGLIALAMGLISGYFGGLVDDVMSMIINIFLVIPSLPLLIVIASFLPVKGVYVIILIISFTSWSYGARLFRSQVLSLKNRDFVKASIVIGENPFRIIFMDILPNMLSLIIANFFATCLGAILSEAGLEFIGLGDAGVMSWGTILFWAQNGGAFVNKQWQWITVPGLCIALVGAGFALLNFAVDEIANPKLRTLKRIKITRSSGK
jgi:peptide/nickel transport system permease protein